MSRSQEMKFVFRKRFMFVFINNGTAFRMEFTVKDTQLNKLKLFPTEFIFIIQFLLAV